MKTLILIAAALTSSLTSASILHSDYNEKLNSNIEKAIEAECGKMNWLEVVSAKKQRVQVDQGIVDYKYTTELKGTSPEFKRYSVTVTTWYYDSYDHSTQDWGSYHTESVECAPLYK